MKKINYSAREHRHSRIDFKDGHYQQKRRESKKIFLRFFQRVLGLSFIFFFSYFASYQLVAAYPQNIESDTPIQLDSSQVFILQESGFVLKPSSQTVQGDRSSSNEIVHYTIEPGDTLFGIAAKFGIRTQTITDNNGISVWTKLKPGQSLKILPVDGLLHEVKEKETLTTIAAKYKQKKEDILRQNKLTEEDQITGLTLIIPGAKKAAAPVYANAPLYTPSAFTGDISGSYIWPCNGKLTQYFHRGHYALDIASAGKGPIYATANGVVIKAQGGWNGGYGNMIIIDHGNGLKSLYAHNEKLYVKVGDEIKQGDTIAWMGNTGRVRGKTGIHLHFEIIHNGVKKNPLAYIGTR